MILVSKVTDRDAQEFVFSWTLSVGITAWPQLRMLTSGEDLYFASPQCRRINFILKFYFGVSQSMK